MTNRVLAMIQVIVFTAYVTLSRVVSVLWKREWLPEEYRQENRNKKPTVSVLWKREWLPEEYRQENRNKKPTVSNWVISWGLSF
ncbi:hypothetical protein NDU88_004845 [Pleurodeles waltl]|uniref:Uncharacterized protein n=1 Tax=Pleurodeles waltl TaxID=8319 RepID=A0AAV7L1E8_PLEWA|nr:hypothetical protein NDU88_004845 [Pleurodeles waltl]